MRRSICGRSSLALGSVVMMRSLWISDASWLRNNIARCPLVRPSLRLTIPCLIEYFPSRYSLLALKLLPHLATSGGNAGHAERQTQAGENVFDLVERLAAEVLGGEHLALGPLHQIAQSADVGVLEAVRGADGEVELLDRLGKHLRQARVDFRSGNLFDLLTAGLDGAEDAQVIAEELGSQAEGFLGGDGGVGPDLENELVVVGGLADAGPFDAVVDAAH